MIYETWFDKLFHRHTRESIKERVYQSRVLDVRSDDEDITDRTRKKLKKSHVSLGFALDRVIRELRQGNRDGHE